MYQNKKSTNKYIKDKIKVLKQFGIKVDESIEGELRSMSSRSDIDRRCRTIIRNHIDRINDTDSQLRRSGKKVP